MKFNLHEIHSGRSHSSEFSIKRIGHVGCPFFSHLVICHGLLCWYRKIIMQCSQFAAHHCKLCMYVCHMRQCNFFHFKLIFIIVWIDFTWLTKKGNQKIRQCACHPFQSIHWHADQAFTLKWKWAKYSISIFFWSDADGKSQCIHFSTYVK